MREREGVEDRDKCERTQFCIGSQPLVDVVSAPALLALDKVLGKKLLSLILPQIPFPASLWDACSALAVLCGW